MTDTEGAPLRDGAVGGLLARSRRPAIVPGRMLVAETLPSVDGPLQETMADAAPGGPPQNAPLGARADAPESAAGSDRADTGPRGGDRGTTALGPARPRAASASVDVESGARTPIRMPVEAAEPESAPIRARTAEPDGVAEPVIPRALRRVEAEAAPSRAAEPLQADPLPPLATLTARAVREAVDAPVVPVRVEHAEPEATGLSTDRSVPAADRVSAIVAARPGPAVDQTPPVTIGEIHVHVAPPAETAPDPLALLAPWANGLTARRTAPA